MFRKFIDWLEFHPPTALSWDGWTDFNKEFREKAPIRYFLVKVLWARARRIAYLFTEAQRWVEYRTVRRYHVLDTGLPPGWHDVPEKMLHVNFNMLVDYVEQECAWIHIAFDEEKRKEVLGWRYHAPRFFRRNWRNKELGIQHLEWEMTLDDPDLPVYDQSPHQAAKARKVMMLYRWWTEERPLREELEYPLEDSPGLETLSQRWKSANPEKDAALTDWSKEFHALEEAWKAEDNAMLIELVKVRHGLWT
jgi:hypothetical protein